MKNYKEEETNEQYEKDKLNYGKDNFLGVHFLNDEIKMYK